MPREQIAYVGYFTAPVDPAGGRGKSERQRAYLLARESIPQVDVVLSNFRWVHHKGTLDENGIGPQQTFWHWEEKGSDVNVAMRMVRDACLKRYVKMLLVSNDSDVAGPVQMVTGELNIPVIQCSPDTTINRALRDVSTDSIMLQTRRLGACMLPDQGELPNGLVVSRPGTWN